MLLNYLISAALSLVCLISSAQTADIYFNVFFKNKNIGKMHAVETRSGNKSIKDLSSQTDVSIFAMSVHVESEVKSTHDNGVLVNGVSYRHANRGSEDVAGQVTKTGEKLYEVVRNGKKSKIEKKEITICVIDLMFREPKGINLVFSNMYADFLQLTEIAPGKYKLVTKDKKDSIYEYKNGKLVKIEVDTPLGKVTSIRAN